jgi:hypothetical protein
VSKQNYDLSRNFKYCAQRRKKPWKYLFYKIDRKSAIHWANQLFQKLTHIYVLVMWLLKHRQRLLTHPVEWQPCFPCIGTRAHSFSPDWQKLVGSTFCEARVIFFDSGRGNEAVLEKNQFLADLRSCLGWLDPKIKCPSRDWSFLPHLSLSLSLSPSFSLCLSLSLSLFLLLSLSVSPFLPLFSLSISLSLSRSLSLSFSFSLSLFLALFLSLISRGYFCFSAVLFFDCLVAAIWYTANRQVPAGNGIRGEMG